MSLASDLTALLGAEQVDVSDAVRAQHSRGEAYAGAVLPDVVVFPRATAEVARLLAYASAHGVPVTPVGANSSLEGHTVPVRGGVSLDLTRMDRVLEVRPQDLLAVVQPGVTYPRLNERLRHHGLFFPVDPGAHATLGGMVSTNASGTAAVRYGTTGDHVLALEVVTPQGEVLRLGSRARKSASGYDLCALFTGAEGTLGVITEVTVKLVGLPEAVAAARVPFADALTATTFVTRLIQAGVPVARCELVDPYSIRAANAYSGTSFPEEMTVFLEFHGNAPGVAAELELARELALSLGAGAFEAATDAAERERLWRTRHTMFFAANAANPGLESLVTDVAVPISELPTAVTTALAECAAAGFEANLVGHVGDGNFHLNLYLPEDPAARAAAKGVVDRLTERALAVGGTATGEHGVGLRKLGYMEREHGASLGLMRAIKQLLDPAGIMNPGKKLPEAP
ncbi:MAG: FAD-binding protein [Deinococcales bacterium]|nr:FAD-binding protein [Deinococcales bacterium]